MPRCMSSVLIILCTCPFRLFCEGIFVLPYLLSQPKKKIELPRCQAKPYDPFAPKLRVSKNVSLFKYVLDARAHQNTFGYKYEPHPRCWCPAGSHKSAGFVQNIVSKMSTVKPYLHLKPSNHHKQAEKKSEKYPPIKETQPKDASHKCLALTCPLGTSEHLSWDTERNQDLRRNGIN